MVNLGKLSHRSERAPGGGCEPSPPQSHVARAAVCVRTAEQLAIAGDRRGALQHFDCALDTYLEGGLYLSAASVAAALLRHFPDVVRARGSMAVLSLAEALPVLSPGVLFMVRADFDLYVDTAQEMGKEHAAMRSLRLLAGETESPRVREFFSELLDRLGDRRGAEEVFLSAVEEREGIRPPRAWAGSQQERWAALLRRPIRA